MSTGRIFVGDLNNGNVWVGSLDGQPFTLFANASQVGRSNALGLATDESRRKLFIVSNAQGRVDIVNLDNGGHIASVSLPGAVGLNDVTVAPDGTAYVTDMGRPQIFRIGAGATTGELWVDYSGSGAVATAGHSLHGNGIVADASTVLVAYMETGELIRFERSTGNVARVQHNGGGITGRDGLVRCGNTLLGVDNTSFAGGQNTVWVSRLSADRQTSTASGTVNANNLSIPSTAALLGDQLIIVNAQFGVARQTPFWLSVVDAPC